MILALLNHFLQVQSLGGSFSFSLKENNNNNKNGLCVYFLKSRALGAQLQRGAAEAEGAGSLISAETLPASAGAALGAALWAAPWARPAGG